MNHILGRSYLPPYLVDHLYKESQCQKLKSTLLHINELMSRGYSTEDKEHLKQLFTCSARPGTNYERIIRDAQEKAFLPNHTHSNLPICSRSDLSLEPTYPSPDELHMPHEDYLIVMKEGDPAQPYTPVQIVYDSIGYVRQFYKEKLNIDKIFGCDSQINAVVHFDKNYPNAFWNSQAIYFGDGDSIYFGPFYNDIDIIAHELTHGFITFTTDFDYIFQSGALNESVADVVGIMVKQYVANETAAESNWLLGENLFINKAKAPALRSMAAPGTAYRLSETNRDPQVGHMRDYKNLSIFQDNGGVHINSGIPNKAFYLLATTLGGYSWEVAGQIWIRTIFDKTLSTRATFDDFAKATIRTATEKFDHHVVNLTRKSWENVGIYV
ncbi:TPA: M4 family metallopeptidase [Providencia stuartii]|uniref:M4 family metallopeptidase n=1 Tax=Providencia stuartii TaxID=588 RepID=UPI0011401449|nr:MULTISPECIES: M4 family metallopeptidase [Providencia]MBN5559493.1 M4 family metallopeptidase [Providencia stuartii]MBN5601445.1 M4 family metallopeptidase [Providencia stuartii]MBN5605013.1 M4 family metallopeptidase [Providencia stuartii]MCL8324980.1 M4 family metallopeptidase [Providencia thailandensis]MDF4175531.1 M4 family metallopeptidase [Providencia thailandensis]